MRSVAPLSICKLYAKHARRGKRGLAGRPVHCAMASALHSDCAPHHFGTRQWSTLEKPDMIQKWQAPSVFCITLRTCADLAGHINPELALVACWFLSTAYRNCLTLADSGNILFIRCNTLKSSAIVCALVFARATCKINNT